MATCWNEALNEQLVAQCEQGGPMCAPQSVAQLLALPYCEGECGGGQSNTLKWVVGGATVIVVALLLRRGLEG